MIWLTALTFLPLTLGLVSDIINILHVDDSSNGKARQAIAAAVIYANNNTELEVNVDFYGGQGNLEAYEHLNEMCHLYDKMLNNGQPPDLVIDSSHYHSVKKAARLLSRKLMLPEIVLSMGHKPRNTTFDERKLILKIRPPADTIPTIVDQVLTKLNISNVVIFYDPAEFSMNGLLQQLQAGKRQYIIRRIEPKPKRLREQELRYLRNEKGMKSFFVLGSLENIISFLESVDRKFFNRTFSWTVVSSTSKELVVHLRNATIMYIRPMAEDKQQLEVVHQFFGLNDEDVVLDVSSIFYFEITLRAIYAVRDAKLTDTWNISTIRCQEFNGTQVPNDVDLKSLFQRVSNLSHTYGHLVYDEVEKSIDIIEGRLELTMAIEAVTIEDGETKAKTTLGSWQAGPNNDITVLDQNIFMAMRPLDVVRVVTALKPPFVMRDPTSPHGYTGFCIDLMDRIADYNNFSYEIHVAEEVGKLNKHGQWTGIIRELRSKNYDVGLGAVSVMAERQTEVDFTVPFYDLVGIHIMMLDTKPPTSMMKFLEVLEPDVWICILGTYFLASFLMWLFARFSPYSYQNNRERFSDEQDKREFSLRECLWFCMTSLTPQGGGDAPKNLSSRLIAATWWLYGFIIMASYTANLAAFLTLPRFDHDLQTLEDFSLQYKIRYAPISGNQAADYFERMAMIEQRFYHIWEKKALNISLSASERARLAVWEFPVGDKYTKLWKAIQETGLYTSLDQALEKVRSTTSSSGYAFIGDSDDIRYQVMINCDLKVVGEVFSKKPYAIALQKGSDLKGPFDEAILDLLNKREIETMKTKWWTHDKKCSAIEDPSNGISMSNIGGVFMVILVGLAISLVTLMCEYWQHQRRITAETRASHQVFRIINVIDDDEHSNHSIYTSIPMLRKRARSQSLSYDFKP